MEPIDPVLVSVARQFVDALTLFGGLLFWPVLRRRLRSGDRRGPWLKRIFIAHLVALPLSFAMVFALSATGADSLPILFLPHAIGMASVVASLLVLLLCTATGGRGGAPTGP